MKKIKFSDIKIKHVYYVDFDPIEGNEFNGKHLSLVLKLNKDKRTVVVLPLTSSPQGAGNNKVSLGCIASLPSNINTNETFAVLDHVRSVDAKRFYPLREQKSGSNIIESNIDNSCFLDIFSLIFKNVTAGVTKQERISIFRYTYHKELCKHLSDLAYDILRENHLSIPDQSKIQRIKAEIQDIIFSETKLSWNDFVDDKVKNVISAIIEN